MVEFDGFNTFDSQFIHDNTVSFKFNTLFGINFLDDVDVVIFISGLGNDFTFFQQRICFDGIIHLSGKPLQIDSRYIQ
jgi:hypothetical protein